MFLLVLIFLVTRLAHKYIFSNEAHACWSAHNVIEGGQGCLQKSLEISSGLMGCYNHSLHIRFVDAQPTSQDCLPPGHTRMWSFLHQSHVLAGSCEGLRLLSKLLLSWWGYWGLSRKHENLALVSEINFACRQLEPSIVRSMETAGKLYCSQNKACFYSTDKTPHHCVQISYCFCLCLWVYVYIAASRPDYIAGVLFSWAEHLILLLPCLSTFNVGISKPWSKTKKDKNSSWLS